MKMEIFHSQNFQNLLFFLKFMFSKIYQNFRNGKAQISQLEIFPS